VTPLLVVAVVAGAVLLLVRGRRWELGARPRIVAGLSAAGVVLSLLPVKVGGWSPWALVWAAVPGAHAIRVTDRLQLMTNVVFVIALALALDTVLDRMMLRLSGSRKAVAIGMVAALGLMLAAEQVQVDHDASVDRDAELAMLAAVPPVPAMCRTFYVTDASPGRPFYAVQIDAMLISVTEDVPTVNGYGGLSPDGWSPLDPASPGYRDAIAAWVTSNGLSLADTCVYDLGTATWSLGG
jgi:hypothetical protein